MGDIQQGMRVRLLGGFGVSVDEVPVVLPGPAARVVAITALRGRLRRENAVDELWPEAPGGRGQDYLRSALWRLGTLAPGLIVSRSGGVLRISQDATVDAVALLSWALRVTRDDCPAPAPDVDGLGEELLPGWFDGWLDVTREQLQVLVPEALETTALARLSEGALAPALWYALRAHQLDPLRESAIRILVRIHQLRGNQAQARQTFHDYQRRVRAELGVEPSPDLSGLLTLR